MDRRVADDAVIRPAPARLELGLDEGDDRSVGAGPERRRDGPEDEPERDERDVDDGEARPAPEASPRSSVRAFVRSIETTRSSRRSESASWPRPTSTAYTRRAPRWRRTSVKPPVDAPTSRQTRPAGSMPNASSAAASLWPPRLTYGSRSVSASGVAASTRSPALRSRRAASPSPTLTLPASTSAWAFARVSARPRSTRSWSRRRRADFPVDVEVGLTRLSWHSPLHRGSPSGSAATPPLRARRQVSPAPRPIATSVSRTWAARPGASSRSIRRRSVTEPWSTNRPPGMPMILTRTSRSAASVSRASSIASRTPDPNPPVSTLSSNVTTSFLPRAWSRIRSRSSGCGEAGVDHADRPPVAASASAASSARATIGPNPTKSTSMPSRRTSPRPIGRTSGSIAAQAEPRVARVVEGERVILGEGRSEERPQLLLVLRRRDDEIRELALGREREHPLVTRPVLPDEPGAIDREQDRLVVLADVVDGLVEGPLEERRVERDHRPHAAHRQPGRERHRMLLGDPDVDKPLRVSRLELGHTRPGRHAGRDSDDPAVGPGKLDQLRREDRGVVRVLLRRRHGGRRGRVVGHRFGRHRRLRGDGRLGRRRDGRANRGAVPVRRRDAHRRERRAVEANLVGLGRREAVDPSASGHGR